MVPVFGAGRWLLRRADHRQISLRLLALPGGLRRVSKTDLYLIVFEAKRINCSVIVIFIVASHIAYSIRFKGL